MRSLAKLLAFVLVACLGMSCSNHYCATYSSTTYNQSFAYSPEKQLTYKPVKVHEFKKTKKKKEKKEKMEMAR